MAQDCHCRDSCNAGLWVCIERKESQMSVRVTYEHELGELKQDLKEMAHMVESAIEQTFTAFEDHDYMMAEDVIKGDRTVNDMERAIESRCLSLILRQQPVASDLRRYPPPSRW